MYSGFSPTVQRPPFGGSRPCLGIDSSDCKLAVVVFCDPIFVADSNFKGVFQSSGVVSSKAQSNDTMPVPNPSHSPCSSSKLVPAPMPVSSPAPVSSPPVLDRPPENPQASRLLEGFRSEMYRSTTDFALCAEAFSAQKLRIVLGRFRDALPTAQLHSRLYRLSLLRISPASQHTRSFPALRGSWPPVNRPVPTTSTAVHCTVLFRLAHQLLDIFGQLHDLSVVQAQQGSFANVVGRRMPMQRAWACGRLRPVPSGKSKLYPALVSNKVDLLDRCALLDPMPAISEEYRWTLEDASLLFPDGSGSLPQRVVFTSGFRCQYIDLLERQLRAGKVHLMLRPATAAGAFTIGKQGKDSLREIWNGSVATSAAIPPPKHPFQANPCSLAGLEASADQPLWVSGRDATMFFDKFVVPGALVPFLGRPVVTAAELTTGSGRFLLSELEVDLLDHVSPLDPEPEMTPVSVAWPMGFGWSSFVAQSYMVNTCPSAGFTTEQLFTEEGRCLQKGQPRCRSPLTTSCASSGAPRRRSNILTSSPLVPGRCMGGQRLARKSGRSL